MKSRECHRFMDAWDAYRDGRLPETEHATAKQHLDTCPECAARYHSIEGIAAELRALEMDPFARRRIAFAAASFRRPQRTRRFPVAKRALFVTVCTLVIVSLALVFLLTGIEESPSLMIVPSEVGTATHISRVADFQPQCDATYLRGREVTVFPGTSLYLSSDAALQTIRISETEAIYSLESGRAVAEIGAHNPDFRFVLLTPRGEFEARGTVFFVNVAADGTETAGVTEGVVEVRAEQTADAVVLTEGTAVSVSRDGFAFRPANIAEQREIACMTGSTDACDRQEISAVPDDTAGHMARTPREPHIQMAAALDAGRLDEASKISTDADFEDSDRVSTVKLLARLARSYRSAKRFGEAKNVYLRLINAYPNSDTANDSLVALGQIEYRTLNQPNDALAHFSRYLVANPNGFLAETARAERIRVLAATGRFFDVIKAADEYTALHGDGAGLAEIRRRRADALAKTGRCPEALDEYRRVIEKWPGTMEAKHAEKGAASCD